MRELRFFVDVTMERITLDNRWQSERWQPARVSTGAQPGDDIVYDRDGVDGSRWTARGVCVSVHPSEAEGYFLNITSPDPKLFVMWRREEEGAEPPVRVVVVTLSYNEAARSLDAGEQVDGLPLPNDLAEWLKPFVAEHYKPEPRRKVRRNDPFADKVS
ncbi:MAG TPA: DUF3305 domain-containing protein [Casimicrobiaceae bacterium]|nr:DUF3305 domain-containing protein [Casimicrobiaceae bacterium]